MLKWIKNAFTEGIVKIKYIAYDDSVPEEEIAPYEKIATLEYEGEYNEFEIKFKLRKFVRLTTNHLVVEMTVVERIENGKTVE